MSHSVLFPRKGVETQGAVTHEGGKPAGQGVVAQPGVWQGGLRSSRRCSKWLCFQVSGPQGQLAQKVFLEAGTAEGGKIKRSQNKSWAPCAQACRNALTLEPLFTLASEFSTEGGPIPSCNFLLKSYWESCWKGVTKQEDCILPHDLGGQVHLVSPSWKRLGQVFTQRLSASRLLTLIHTLGCWSWESANCLSQTPCWLTSHEGLSTGGLDRRLDGGRWRFTHLPEARQLRFQPQPPPAFPVPEMPHQRYQHWLAHQI